jgi:outer membrane protein assembly factor BamB
MIEPIYRLLPIFLAAALVGGCGIFGKDEPADPPVELASFDREFRVRQVWSVKIGGDTENLYLGLNPASDGARVYAASNDGKIIAVDTISGKTYWKTEMDIPFSGGPGVGEGMLALGTGNGDVVALNTLDGTKRWQIRLSGEVLSAPAISRNIVVVRTVDGSVHGLSVTDGSQVWLVEREVPRLTLRGNSSPVINGDVVICGFDDGRVMAISLEDGITVWDTLVSPATGRTEIERLSDIDGQLLIMGADIFVSSYQGRAAMLALESGQAWWERELSSHRGISSDGSTLYLTDDKSHIVAMARRNGEILWQQDALHRRMLTTTAVYGSFLVAGDMEGYLHWFNRADGRLAARNKVGGGRISATPLVLDDLVFVQSEGGRLSAFRAKLPAKED